MEAYEWAVWAHLSRKPDESNVNNERNTIWSKTEYDGCIFIGGVYAYQ